MKPDRSLPISWFLRLRRFAFVGNVLILIWALYIAELGLPALSLVGTLLLLPAGETLFRLISHNCQAKSQDSLIGLLLAWDTLSLTLLLYLSGGPTNPLSIIYLVHVVLSATLLGSIWPWLIAGLSSVCFAFLFGWHHPIHELHHMDHSAGMSLHLKGMLFSYALAASLVAYFLGRILSEKQESEIRIKRLTDAQQKLAAMTALSTNAAHRLGTPLASLGLVSHELLRLIDNRTSISVKDIKEDLHLFKEEILRCKSILRDLCAEAGNLTGESPRETSSAALVDTLKFSESIPVGRLIVEGGESTPLRLQTSPVQLALKAIISNAFEASAPQATVTLKITQSSKHLTFSVTDAGTGMNAAEIEKIKEPFYTTKDSGMGLGVYIADLIALQLEGSLRYVSSLGIGTTAILTIPYQPFAKAGVAA